jgi:predicted RNA-binding protein with PIN domain
VTDEGVTEEAEMDEAASQLPEEAPSLPEAVRSRVLGLAAEALGKMAPENLPASLKRVASFAPARRARLAGSQIAGVLESDPQFRERLAIQVQGISGELAKALLEGRPPAAADPVEAAATAYLLRSPGWPDVVRSASDSLRSERLLVEAQRTDEQQERLRRRVGDLEEELESQRARHKEQLDKLKREYTEVRTRLGEARARAREAEEAAETGRAEADKSASTSAQALAAAEAEVRRLRGRVGELETELGAARRTERAERVSGTVRARLLLETLGQAAQGLQRELSLPALDRLPGDTVDAVPGEEGSRTSAGRGSLAVDDPALLEELLRLPRAHLVIDGYNITKQAWPEAPLDRQRERLLTGVAALLARTKAEVTVVFDAAETKERPLVAPPRGVRVLFSRYGVIADDVIREMVAAEPPGRAVVVASSDQAVARDVVAAGFRVVAAGALSALLKGSRG